MHNSWDILYFHHFNTKGIMRLQCNKPWKHRHLSVIKTYSGQEKNGWHVAKISKCISLKQNFLYFHYILNRYVSGASSTWQKWMDACLSPSHHMISLWPSLLMQVANSTDSWCDSILTNHQQFQQNYIQNWNILFTKKKNVCKTTSVDVPMHVCY